MEIEIKKYETKEIFNISLLNQIGEGSNSYIYDIQGLGNTDENLVAKCSKNNKNFVSFNLQYNSFCACKKLCESDIVVPQIFLYGKSKDIGDILVMQKIENIYEISLIINNSLFYGEIIIKKIAEAIARLHNMGISGYDVEFFWKADTNQLVILDIGPQYTFDFTCEEMIKNHVLLEKNNNMGKWNIVSQIIPKEEAKKWFSCIDNYDCSTLIDYIDFNSIKKHVSNVARIHALSIIAKLTTHKQKYYSDIFVKEYKKCRNTLSINSGIYLKAFMDTIAHNDMSAEACLYYSLANPLCKESCAVHLER